MCKIKSIILNKNLYSLVRKESGIDLETLNTKEIRRSGT